MGRSALLILALGTLSVSASGCANLNKALGNGKNPPDEFAIVTKAPLTVPPDYALRPPAPGETRPERLSTSERTRQLLLGDSTAQPPSRGELAVLQQIDAVNVDPNIRAVLAAENGGRALKDASFANQLIFWRVKDDGGIDDSHAPLRVDDRAAWEQERMESIEAVTGGQDIEIQNKRRVLALPGVK